MADKLMRIQGMTCAHCEQTVAEALTAAGALDVVADWRAGQAQLDATAASDEQLSTVMEEAGYRVLSIEGVRRAEPVLTPMVSDNSHHDPGGAGVRVGGVRRSYYRNRGGGPGGLDGVERGGSHLRQRRLRAFQSHAGARRTLLQGRADHCGRSWRLGGKLTGGPVLLVFYGGDWRPYCSGQLASYARNWESFARAGLQVAAMRGHGRAEPCHGRQAAAALADPERTILTHL